MSAQAASSSHTNLRPEQEIRTSCLNPSPRPYVQDGSTSRGQLTPHQLLARLRKVDLRSSSQLMVNAHQMIGGTGLSARELLHCAIDRALKPSTNRPRDVLPSAYLTMIMWSIASDVRLAKARAKLRGSTTPFDLVDEQVPDTRSIVDPVRTIIWRDEQAFFERLLGQVAGGDNVLETLIDEIVFGHRGESLEKRLGVSTVELATLRRRLKRRAQAIAAREGLMRADTCLPHSS